MKSLRSVVLLILFSLSGFGDLPKSEPQLRLCLRSDPRTFDPLLVDEEAGEVIRYLTGGVLIRLNRSTQKLEPELAESWKVSKDGRKVTFILRKGVRWSDGTVLTPQDVASTLRRMMDPAVHSPVGDSFRAGGSTAQVSVEEVNHVVVQFPTAVAGVERLFDQVAIMSAKSSANERPSLGAFVISEYVPGHHITLKRNANYWRRDEKGRVLPYLESIRLDIQANRDIELLRFRRGELHMVTGLDAAAFEQLKSERPDSVIDAGPSYDNEMLWFNQVAKSPIPQYKKDWFRSQVFRRALSEAINRHDIARLVYRGYAQPAAGPFSEANRMWFNSRIQPPAYSPDMSLQKLRAAGFRSTGGKLYDSRGNLVEFSLITNSGNRARLRIASLVQQDLAKIGIRMNVVSLDFPALIERISRTYNYEACLLGLVNVDHDPNGQMNVWLSSAANHQWNPKQKSPETQWEAEIDRLMRLQASSPSYEKRKAAFDRVQEIVADQAPFVYLVTKNALAAASPNLKNLVPSSMLPHLLWNAPYLAFAAANSASR
jgi:peptide/nickel transport system substrate-binding protein